MQSLEELLKLDPANQEAGKLKIQIEEHVREKQIVDWMMSAQASLKSHHFAFARQTLRKVLDIRRERVASALSETTLKQCTSSATENRQAVGKNPAASLSYTHGSEYSSSTRSRVSTATVGRGLSTTSWGYQEAPLAPSEIL